MRNFIPAAVDLPELILASGSPRRAEILTSVGWPFVRSIPDVDEAEMPGEDPAVYVSRLAKEKAASIAAENPDRIVLGADTTVVIDGKILGKPADRDEAFRMISELSGNWHEVLTGVTLFLNSTEASGIQRTRVKFAEMSESEVDFLVERGDPFDKAGGYAVQAQAALFIEEISGDYWNVVGLPIQLVYGLVREIGKQKEQAQ